ncbi:MAG: hypothetical protein KatS3mg068_2317 [Candidatus Sericytochromatia bacterium]|nr:MAG: hypothetical protein KatS3mg068_2317 [Candidatus Sericytochromatia bacterium]
MKFLEEKIKEALKYYKNHDFEKVVIILKYFIDNIDNPNIIFIYGKSLILLDNASGINYLLRALELKPNDINILGEIALFYINQQIEDKAEYYIDKALKIESNNPYILYLKGCVKNIQENFKEALFFYEKSYNINPKFVPLLIDIGNVYKNKKEYDKALNFYFRVLEIDKDNKGTLNNIGIVYLLKKDFRKSKEYFFKCFNIDIDYYNLIEDKIEFWQNYFLLNKLNKEFISYFIGFSELLSEENYIEESLFILDYLELKSFKNKDKLYLAKGNLYSKVGDAKTAIKNYIKGNQINKRNSNIINNILSLYYYENYGNEKYKYYLNLFNFSQKNNKEYDFFFNKNNQKIKIGYVSQDFSLHSIIYFLQLLYKNHNKNDFEIFSYYLNEIFDKDTELFKNYSDYWREVYNLIDAEISNIIYNDKIDILVDLSGFTHKSRVEVFSYKPAPVQISMIGYHDGSAGLETMDYKILR